MDRVLGTLVCARQTLSPKGNSSPGKGAQVLMLHRNKEPNKGLWVAPGGKVEMHEAPADAIFFPRIIDDDEPLYQARYTYDADLQLVHVEEFILEEGR